MINCNGRHFECPEYVSLNGDDDCAIYRIVQNTADNFHEYNKQLSQLEEEINSCMDGID
jgi:hypothetical protein